MLTEKPYEHNDVSVNNDSSQNTHHHRPQPNQVGVIQGDGQRDATDDQKAGDELGNLLQQCGVVAVVVAEGQEVVSVILH